MLNKLLALGLDAFYETLDKRSFQIVSALSLLAVLIGASIGFKPIPFEEVATQEIPRHVGGAGPLAPGKPSLQVVRVDSESPGVYAVQLEILRPAAVRQAMQMRTWRDNMAYGRKAGPNPHFKPRVQDLRPLSDVEIETLLRSLGSRLNYGYQSHSGSHPNYVVRFEPPYLHEVSGGGKLSVFGIFETALPPRLTSDTQRSFADLILDMQEFVANWVAGFFGIFIAIVFTGGLLPSTLREGSIDLLLSKPIDRSLFFLGKYLGGLLYVFFTAVVLIGGFWLASSIRSGLWNFGFLLTILGVTMLFAVIYTVSVFWAVMSRSTVTSILMTVVSMFFFIIITLIKRTTTELSQMNMIPDWLVRGSEILYWIFPSTGDFDVLNAWFISQAPISPGLRDGFLASSRYFSTTASTPLWASIGSSMIFALVVLSVSCVIFSRKDY